MPTIALHQKYRPTTLTELVGQPYTSKPVSAPVLLTFGQERSPLPSTIPWAIALLFVTICDFLSVALCDRYTQRRPAKSALQSKQ